MATSNFPEHEILCQLEKSVLDTIKDYGESVGDPQKQPKMLEASIQSKFSQLRALTRDLEELVEELDSDEDRQHVARLLTAHASEYNSIQHAFKAAALQRRQKVAQIAASERQQLLGTPEAALRRRQMATDADVVGASENITDSLRRTRQMMSEELEHTSATLAAMDTSHAQLSKTTDEYLDQHGLLKRSTGLLRTINWQQRSETMLLWCGLILFGITAAYVAQKRVLYFVPEPLRPMALMKTTFNVIRGGNAPENGVLKGTPITAPLREEAALPLPPLHQQLNEENFHHKEVEVVEGDAAAHRDELDGALRESNENEEKVPPIAELKKKVDDAADGAGVNNESVEEIENDEFTAEHVHTEL